jgi:4-diphosphocytidyl-2-C-methyl-D-erythritol kinase
VLVNPGAALATKLVFAGWKPAAAPAETFDLAALSQAASFDKFLSMLATQPNDLESAAIGLAPEVADVIAELAALAGCRLARMSGSGATCFGLFTSAAQAVAAAKTLRAKYPDWWVCETMFG